MSKADCYNPVILEQWFDSCGLPKVEFEYKFHPERRWRFDIAFPTIRVAVEVEGGIWSGGRHVRPGGFVGDMQKYNAAAALGWSVLRVQPKELESGELIELVKETLRAKAGTRNGEEEAEDE